MSDARREGREFEGFCLNPPNVFRIADGLAVYGGLEAVEKACCGCVANAAAAEYPPALAGCFGIVAFTDDVASAMAAALSRPDFQAAYDTLFLPTQPRRYGLWAHTSMNREQCAFVQRVVTDVGANFESIELRELASGLAAAIDRQLAFHVSYFPAGWVEGTSWKLAPHCPRCKAPWPATTARLCGVCAYEGIPAPDKRRKSRGTRPYFPLDRLLGETAARDLLVRYEEFRTQRELIRPAQTQLRAGLPDSLPAD